MGLNIFKQSIKYADQEDLKLLLFIGSPRTGSTLLGQIVNYHPECLISSESRFMTNIMKGQQQEKAVKNIRKMALEQFKKGLEGYLDKQTIDRYQPKWRPMQHLVNEPEFAKKLIHVIGDKKAGGTTEAYKENPQRFLEVINSTPNVYLLQIVRNPIHAANSLIKSHEHKHFESACEFILQGTSKALELKDEEITPHHILYYENLMSQPKEEIRAIFEWLGLNVNPDWLEKICNIVNNSSNAKLITDEEQAIANGLIKKYNAEKYLDHYMS